MANAEELATKNVFFSWKEILKLEKHYNHHIVAIYRKKNFTHLYFVVDITDIFLILYRAILSKKGICIVESSFEIG